MSQDTIDKLQAYKDSLISKAETLITKGLPEKIVELNGIIASLMFNEKIFKDFSVLAPNVMQNQDVQDNASDDHFVPKHARKDDCNMNTVGLGLTTNHMLSNKKVCDLMKIVKPIVCKLVKDLTTLKMWISLTIPKVEGGDNFGVAIQKNTLSLIELIESAAGDWLDMTSYFLQRAQLLRKSVKYKRMEDYRRAVNGLDETQYLRQFYIVCEVRNRYAALHDKITKNLEKLKNPRTSNMERLY